MIQKGTQLGSRFPSFKALLTNFCFFCLFVQFLNYVDNKVLTKHFVCHSQSKKFYFETQFKISFSSDLPILAKVALDL